ncbi:MAG: sterol desaturase family protein, partial [Myxococcales bacterium]|nr:sterol desaturase family protein [Myxococcales bacterium]
MDRLETSGYYALGVPFYLLLIAVEWYRTRRLGLHAYRFADTIGNVSAGLGELIIGLFLGPWLIALYDFAYAHFALIHWPKGSIAQWVVAFLAADLGYYWYHRAGHRFGALWAIHGVHHQSEQFNFTIAMRHPWLSDTYSAVFYAPLPLLGVEPTVFFVSISAISFYALTVHTRLFHRPTLGIFVTPATHIVHHCRNPRYIGRNLGAMFILWDKLFGTYTEIVPEDPPDIGTPAGYQTHDGAKAQAIFFRDLWRAARQA